MDVGAKRTGAALLVILMGAALFTFGTLGARHRLPGSRAFQAVGVAAIMLALLALFTIHGG
jgi:hypothetical protein